MNLIISFHFFFFIKRSLGVLNIWTNWLWALQQHKFHLLLFSKDSLERMMKKEKKMHPLLVRVIDIEIFESSERILWDLSWRFISICSNKSKVWTIRSTEFFRMPCVLLNYHATYLQRQFIEFFFWIQRRNH